MHKWRWNYIHYLYCDTRFHEDHLDLKGSQVGMAWVESQAHQAGQDPQGREDHRGRLERKVTEDIEAALVSTDHGVLL